MRQKVLRINRIASRQTCKHTNKQQKMNRLVPTSFALPLRCTATVVLVLFPTLLAICICSNGVVAAFAFKAPPAPERVAPMRLFQKTAVVAATNPSCRLRWRTMANRGFSIRGSVRLQRKQQQKNDDPIGTDYSIEEPPCSRPERTR